MKKILLFHLDYLKFIVYPTFGKDNDSGIIRKILRIIWIIIFSFIISFLILRLSCLFPFYGTGRISSRHILEVVIYAPIFEELLFRSILVFSKLNITLFISSVFSLAISFLHLKLDITYWYILQISVFILVFLLLSIIFKKYPKIIVSLNQFHKKHQLLIYIFLVLCFGIIHITNIPHFVKYFHFGMVLYVVSKIVGGVFDSYLRIRYGLLFSIIAHMLNNAFPYIHLL